MQHLWSLICLGSSVDKETNRLSVFDIVDHLTIGLPEVEENIVLPVNYHFVTMWALENHEHSFYGTQRVLLESPSGKILTEHEIAIDLRFHRRYRTRVYFQGLPIQGSGDYIYHVAYLANDSDDWIDTAKITLRIDVEPVNSLQES